MNNNKKTIAFLVPSLAPGGMERVISLLANYFANFNNIEVHIILFGKSHIIFYEINKNIIVHKPKIIRKNSILLILSRLLFIRREVRKLKPDAILSFGIHWNNFVLLSLTGLSYPIIVSDRGSPVRKYLFIHRIMRRVLYKRAKWIIAQTNLSRNLLKEIIPESKIKVIGNPVRLIKNENKNILRENIILSVGRLIASKHFDRLIYIFSRLIISDWKLIIVGGDSLKQNNFEKLQELIKELKINNRVILEGEQKNVERYYLKSKIFAFTSSVEGFPNVIGEALSAGLPVISYDCIAGPSEMIEDGVNGFLVPVFNDEVFAQKLQLLIDNESLRNQMAINALKSIRKFDINKIGKEYLDFILS